MPVRQYVCCHVDVMHGCDRELLRYVRDLWKRGNPDDIQLLLLTLINAYLAEVPLLQNMRAQVWRASCKGCHVPQRCSSQGSWHGARHSLLNRTADQVASSCITCCRIWARW